MNIWQGDFPDLNTAADGYEYTSPVLSFNLFLVHDNIHYYFWNF